MNSKLELINNDKYINDIFKNHFISKNALFNFNFDGEENPSIIVNKLIEIFNKEHFTENRHLGGYRNGQIMDILPIKDDDYGDEFDNLNSLGQIRSGTYGTGIDLVLIRLINMYGIILKDLKCLNFDEFNGILTYNYRDNDLIEVETTDNFGDYDLILSKNFNDIDIEILKESAIKNDFSIKEINENFYPLFSHTREDVINIIHDLKYINQKSYNKLLPIIKNLKIDDSHPKSDILSQIHNQIDILEYTKILNECVREKIKKYILISKLNFVICYFEDIDSSKNIKITTNQYHNLYRKIIEENNKHFPNISGKEKFHIGNGKKYNYDLMHYIKYYKNENYECRENTFSDKYFHYEEEKISRIINNYECICLYKILENYKLNSRYNDDFSIIDLNDKYSHITI